jgi:hypothetical protein
MFPIRDLNRSRRVPVVNFLLIGANAAFFAYELMLGPRLEGFVMAAGFIPERFFAPGGPGLPAELGSALLSMFLHGGWMHFLGNMWFLHIFGDNVEDRFGHAGYLLFYLACGVAASLAHLLSGPNSTIPTIGASGAIAGVMGAYLVSYPHARVQTLVPIVFLIQIVVLPAPVFLGIWFVIQFFQGVATVTDVESTGVAWWAHIGGFAAGAAAAWLLDKGHVLRPRNTQVRPHTEPFAHYRVRRRPPWDQ